MTAPVRPLDQDPLEALKALRAQRNQRERPIAASGEASEEEDPLDALKRMKREREGVVSRGLERFGAGISQIVHHPLQAAETMLAAPIASVFQAAIAPSVGAARPDPRLSKGGNSSGRPIDLSAYDEAHGAVTPGQRWAAGAQAVIATGAGPLFRGVKKVTAPLLRDALSTGAGLTTVGATSGAAYSPDDPGAGAIAGGLMAATSGGGKAGTLRLGKEVPELLDLHDVRTRIKAARPLDETAIEMRATRRAADQEAYGRAAREGDAQETTPAVARALAHPRIKPYADRVRASSLRVPNDATLVRRTYKLMSRARSGLLKQMKRDGYNADAELESANLQAGMRLLKRTAAAESRVQHAETIPAVTTAQSPPPPLRDAIDAFHARPAIAAARREGTVAQQAAREALERHGAESSFPPIRGSNPGPRTEVTTQAVPPLMPSFPSAVAGHARQMTLRDLFGQGADLAHRLALKSSTPSGRLEQPSMTLAAMKDLLSSVDQNGVPSVDAVGARAILRGVLSRAKEDARVSPPHSMTTKTGLVLGLARPVSRMQRLLPLIEAIDLKLGKRPMASTRFDNALQRIPAQIRGPIPIAQLLPLINASIADAPENR